MGGVYVSDEDDLYTEAPSSPENDCYVFLPYRLKVGGGEFRNSAYVRTYESSRWAEQDHLDMLKEYLETTFWGRKGYFLAKCVSLKVALKKCTGRWHICGGTGSDGKGGDYISDKSLLGDYANPMDGVNLTGMDAFRLSGSKMHDAIELRVQEYPHQQILGNIFKRMATNEARECCGKYGTRGAISSAKS